MLLYVHAPADKYTKCELTCTDGVEIKLKCSSGKPTQQNKRERERTSQKQVGEQVSHSHTHVIQHVQCACVVTVELKHLTLETYTQHKRTTHNTNSQSVAISPDVGCVVSAVWWWAVCVVFVCCYLRILDLR